MSKSTNSFLYLPLQSARKNLTVLTIRRKIASFAINNLPSLIMSEQDQRQ